MSNNFKDRLFVVIGSRVSKPCVPNTDKSIIRAACEDAGMELMPSYILNWRVVMQNLKDWQKPPIFLFIFLNVPDANSLISET